MIAPSFATRVEQFNFRARERVDSARVRPLANDVALIARGGEVVGVIEPRIWRCGLEPQRLRDHVVHSQRPTPHVTVLTARSRSSHDEAPGRLGNHFGLSSTAPMTRDARARAPRSGVGRYACEPAELRAL